MEVQLELDLFGTSWVPPLKRYYFGVSLLQENGVVKDSKVVFLTGKVEPELGQLAKDDNGQLYVLNRRLVVSKKLVRQFADAPEFHLIDKNLEIFLAEKLAESVRLMEKLNE